MWASLAVVGAFLVAGLPLMLLGPAALMALVLIGAVSLLLALAHPGDHPWLGRLEWVLPVKGRWARRFLVLLGLLTITLVVLVVATVPAGEAENWIW